MKQGHYTFVSVWHINAPLDEVWDYIIHIEDWPRWWRGVEEARITTSKVEAGHVGSQIQSRWKSWLPYRIKFLLTVTEVCPCTRLSAEAVGDLNGTGVWELNEERGVTTARYTWDVSTTKPWMNLVAPLAKPLFAHAHDTIMRWGEEGLKRELAAHNK